jgi:hypothetical protein
MGVVPERVEERELPFEDFVAGAEPRLRRALCAAYGPQVGREAVRADGSAVDAPAGWTNRPVSPALTQAVALTYVSEGLGYANVTVFTDGGDQVGDLARLPGATSSGDGDQRVVVLPQGADPVAYRSFDHGRYAVVYGDDLPDTTVVELARSLAVVDERTWDAATVEASPAFPYRPDPGQFTTVIATDPAGLDAQPGPDGSWCLRLHQAPATTGIACLARPGAESIRTSNLAGTGFSARAAYGTSDAATASVVVTSADGSEVKATVAPLGDGAVRAWVAVLPAGARIARVDALDASSTVIWRAGP